MQMGRVHTKSKTDSLKLIGTSAILTTCHTCCEVVGDDDSNYAVIIDGIKESDHT